MVLASKPLDATFWWCKYVFFKKIVVWCRFSSHSPLRFNSFSQFSGLQAWNKHNKKPLLFVLWCFACFCSFRAPRRPKTLPPLLLTKVSSLDPRKTFLSLDSTSNPHLYKEIWTIIQWLQCLTTELEIWMLLHDASE